MSSTIFQFISLFALCYAGTPELILYTGTDATGDGLIFRTKQADLMTQFSHIISPMKSYCYKGHWAFYSEKYFDGATMEDDNTESLKCVNMNSSPFVAESIRFLGPDDTDETSITFYESRDFMKKEFIVKQSINLPFVSGSFVSNSGPSQLTNWTFFEENDYLARAVCYIQLQRHEKVNNLKRLFVKGIKTVTKGCNSAHRIGGYYTAADLEEFY